MISDAKNKARELLYDSLKLGQENFLLIKCYQHNHAARPSTEKLYCFVENFLRNC